MCRGQLVHAVWVQYRAVAGQQHRIRLTGMPCLLTQANNKRTLLLAAQFLHEELPIRLARRVRELKKLPFGLGETDAIKEVRKLYEKSFFQIRRYRHT